MPKNKKGKVPLYKKKRSKEEKKFWKEIEEEEGFEVVEEKNVHELKGEHSYEMVDDNLRLVVCKRCEKKGIIHGTRLFPPHLYDLRDGKIYYREDVNSDFRKLKDIETVRGIHEVSDS